MQKDDRFDASHGSCPESISISPLMSHLADGPPTLRIPNKLGPQQSPLPGNAPLRRASESVEVQPIQETHASLRAASSLPHSVEQDAPYYGTHSNPTPTSTEPPAAAAAGMVNRPEPLGYSPPQQQSHASGGKLGYGLDTSGDSIPEDDEEIQPLLDLGERKIYCLRFAGDLGGLIVGKGGSNVRMVEEESHAQVHVMPQAALAEDVKVLVIGTKESCMKAIDLMTQQLKHKTASLQKYMEIIQLPDALAGKIIGQKGSTIHMIERYSGAALTVEKRPEGLSAFFDGGVRKCKILGSREQVEKAKSMISDIQQGKDISHLQLIYAFSQMLQSMPQGMSVLSRLESTEQDEVSSFLGLK